MCPCAVRQPSVHTVHCQCTADARAPRPTATRHGAPAAHTHQYVPGGAGRGASHGISGEARVAYCISRLFFFLYFGFCIQYQIDIMYYVHARTPDHALSNVVVECCGDQTRTTPAVHVASSSTHRTCPDRVLSDS